MSNASERASARVAHQNVYLENERQARIARERAEARRDEFARRRQEAAAHAQVHAGKSAEALAYGSTREARQKRAAELKRLEDKRTAEAIERAAHPPVVDPRSTAQRLADGAGQSRLHL